MSLISRHPSSPLWSAAALAATAIAVHRAARKAEARFPPEGRFIDIDGVRLHYHDRGAGPVVVLLHGNGALASDFAACGLVDALAGSHRVIAFDRPGFGYSERPKGSMWTPDRQAALIADACRALDAPAPVVVGHSWGTHVALALADQPAVRVRGLVLVSGYYFPTPRIDTYLLATPRIPYLGAAMRYTVSPLTARLMLPRLFRRMFHPQPVAPAFLEGVPSSLLLRPWQLRASAEESFLMRSGAKTLAKRYRRLRLPVEIFAGAEDRVVDQPEQVARLQTEIEGSRASLLRGEGHMLHYGHSAEIARAVERIEAATATAGAGTPMKTDAPASPVSA